MHINDLTNTFVTKNIVIYDSTSQPSTSTYVNLESNIGVDGYKPISVSIECNSIRLNVYKTVFNPVTDKLFTGISTTDGEAIGAGKATAAITYVKGSLHGGYIS